MNDRQAEAVQTTEGPLLIMAGAGSGKTRVLTHRIAYLIDEKLVNPWNILAITFTNKAAREMKERAYSLNPATQDCLIATFHSMCVRILRRDADHIGYNRNFTIVDPGEQRTLMKRILKQLNLDPKKWNERSILGTISNAKNDLIDDVGYAAQAGDMYTQIVAQCYTAYQKELRQSESVDFDDLIMLTLRLFDQNPDVLTYYQQKFQYIHVDEYQDTNHAQYQLVKLLASRFKNICVVGDADQSIYGWRGADMQNILDFEKDYPQAKVVLLEENYRSTKTILQAANEVIKNNKNRRPKNLWTQNADGEQIVYYRANDELDEAVFVARTIDELGRSQNFLHKDFAVLYRTNAQSRTIEEALLKSNIPYTMVGGTKFYSRKEIRDIIAYLNLIANLSDNISFDRIINEPKRGIGPGTVEKIRDFANMQNVSMIDASANIMLSGIKGKAAQSIWDFANMILGLWEQLDQLTITELVEAVLEKTGYIDILNGQATLESKARVENIEEFLSVTKNFDDNPDSQEEETGLDKLSRFLNDLALIADTDSGSQETSEVTLMTLHAAKGLEFPVVFIIGMEENVFPLSRAAEDPDELEEERDSKPNRVLNQLVHKLGYRSYIETKSNTTQDAYNRLEALDRLLEMSRKYPTIDAFLAQIDIIKANSQTKGDAINIMTVHASKGLEFQDVFVTGVTEAHYPHQMCIGDIEEERRLLYVAMTRAVSRLHISYGVIEGKSTVGVSPFLEDIAKHELKSARQAVMGGVPKVEFGYKGSL